MGGVIAVGPSGALAEADPTSSAITTAQIATNVAPAPIESAPLVTANNVVIADTNNSDGAASTQITTNPAVATVTSRSASGDTISIDLPTTPSQSTGQIVTTRHGNVAIQSIVYASKKSNEPSVVVQPVSDGSTRIMAVIPGKQAGLTLTYPMTLPNGAKLVTSADGSVQVISSTRTGNMLLGTLSAPWARDAQGNPVATQYKIKGHSIVQVVSPGKSAVYPITADPWWNPFSWNWSAIGHVLLSGLEKCGLGMLGVSSGLVGANVAVNLVRNAAGKYLVSIYGGPYGLIGSAAAGCLANIIH
jgi:hypothetical protein